MPAHLSTIESDATADTVVAGPDTFSIREFHGTTRTLQAFVERTWSSAYEGKMSFPVWTEEYFDWQLNPPCGQPDRRLAAYQGEKLAAVLLGAAGQFATDRESLSGAHWSWLSVDSEFRGCGLARRLDEARMHLERDHASDLVVSYRFTGSRHSLAERPSKKFPLKQFNRKLGFWARPLDGRRLARWNLKRVEGEMSRWITPLLPKTTSRAVAGIRRFESSDLAQCCQAANQQFSKCALRVHWDEAALSRQLAGSPVSQTVVAEVEGRVRGFVNFHILPFQGATREPVGIIDLICVDQLPSRLRGRLLNSALGMMQDQGAILVLKIRSGDVSSALMLNSGFLPRLPDSSLVFQWTRTPRDISKNKPVHLLWR